MAKQNQKMNTSSKTTESKVGRKKMTGRKAANEKNPIQKMAAKVNAPQKLKMIGKKAKGVEPTTVAKGAAAVSIAAGIVAAGAMMADKQNRKKAGKIAVKGMEFVQQIATDMADEAGGKYQAVAQSVPLQRSQKSKSKSKKRKA